MPKKSKNLSKHVMLTRETVERATFLKPMENVLLKKGLTRREIELCAYIFLGASTTEAAYKMNISSSCCYTKTQVILKKLKIESKLKLALYLQHTALCST